MLNISQTPSEELHCFYDSSIENDDDDDDDSMTDGSDIQATVNKNLQQSNPNIKMERPVPAPGSKKVC